ncbi:MAG: hypothetical protein CMK02_03855 [Polycyclovorans sp.]|nr:hypothetical protein [Polycyclovorans sp.]|tara:strand:+ start:6357 stop:6854 length:498 start_codon:yes stop_codon:yes gene_type:complete
MPSTSHYRFQFERSSEQINQAYSDPRYFERMAQAIGGLNVQVLEGRLDAQRMRTVMRMHLDPITPLPGFARKIINGAITITHTVEWNAADRSGSMEVIAAHIPYRATSRMRLESVADTTTDVVSDWTLSIRLPLVGSALERIADEEVRLRLQAECDACDQLMTGA